MTRTVQLFRLCKLLHNLGHEIHVVTILPTKHRQAGETFQKSVPWKISYILSSYNRSSKMCRGIYRYFPFYYTHRFIQNGFKIIKHLMTDWKPDFLFSVSYPISSHQLAYKVKKAFPQLPWITFFSDPWPACIRRYPYHCNQILESFYRAFVQKVLHFADVILFTTPYTTQLYEEVLKIDISSKTFVLPHIPEIMDDLSELTVSDTIQPIVSRPDFAKSLIFTGTIESGLLHSFPCVLLAIKKAQQQHPNSFHGIFIFDKIKNNKRLKKMIKETGTEDIVHLFGAISSKDALTITRMATCNFFVEANETPYLSKTSSKFADYTSVGRPMIVVSPSVSHVTDLIRQNGHGVVTRFQVDEIAHAIEDIFVNSNFYIFKNDKICEYFSHRNLKNILTKILQKID